MNAYTEQVRSTKHDLNEQYIMYCSGTYNMGKDRTANGRIEYR